MRFETSASKRLLTALLSSVILALSSAQVCRAQAVEGGAPLPVYEGDRCGFRDRAGRWVIAPRFLVCGQFEGGMAEVVAGGLRFYVDASGREILERNFASNHFSEGLIPVDIGGKHGFADAEGRLVVFPRFEGASDFAEGLAPVRYGGKWGYIDRTGAFRIAPQFDSAESFSEGLAAVCFNADETKKPSTLELLLSGLSEKCGFVDRAGRLVIEPQFDAAGRFSEGLAPVRVGPNEKVLGDPDAGKWGYVDKTGRLALPLQYAHADEFSEGLAAVRVGKKVGFIDASGALVIEPRFEWASGFRGGLALAALGETKYYWPYKGLSVLGIGLKGLHGYIDRTGEFVSDKLTWKGKWKK